MLHFMHYRFWHNPRADNRRVDTGNRERSFDTEAADRGINVRQLQRSHHQTISEGKGRAVQLAPIAPLRHQSGAFTGQPQPGRVAKTERFIGIDQVLNRHGQRQMRNAGIAGFLQNAGQ